jgi:hypothetical protein
MAERTARMKRILRQQWYGYGPHGGASRAHALDGGRSTLTSRRQAVSAGRKRRQSATGAAGKTTAAVLHVRSQGDDGIDERSAARHGAPQP